MVLSQYLAELKNIRIVTPEEEAALWQGYKEDGDLACRRRLIESYQPLVFKTAMRWRLPETTMLDMIQEGTVGLIEAVENYDHTRGVAFSLFAVHRIRGRIINYLSREDNNLVRIDSPVTADSSQATIADLLIDAQAEVAAQAEHNYLVDQLRTAMDRLPAKEQQVLNSVYLNDCEAKD
ncbi:MAG: sigE 3, partial [Sporomusa sp.]|nr:sigE 3 [Sporomusa sp.]